MMTEYKTFFFLQFQLSNDPSPGYNIEQLAKKYVIHNNFKFAVKLEMCFQFM